MRKRLRLGEEGGADRSATNRLAANEAGQIGLLRVVISDAMPRAWIDSGDAPDRFVSRSFTLFGADRVEYRVRMVSWRDHGGADTVFERMARSFVIDGETVGPPSDFPVSR